MKKLMLMTAGVLLFTGAAFADCGACDAPKEAKNKAACKLGSAQEKSACSIKSAKEKSACSLKGAKAKAACELKAAKQCGPNCKKPCCAAKEVKDNASEKAQEVRKKWWKFGLGK